jgi:hypothetical protein
MDTPLEKYIADRTAPAPFMRLVSLRRGWRSCHRQAGGRDWHPATVTVESIITVPDKAKDTKSR